MKKLFLLLSLLTPTAISASYQQKELPRVPGSPIPGIVLDQVSSKNTSDCSIVRHKAKANNAGLVTAKLTFPELNKEWTLPWSVTAFNGEGFYEIRVEPWDEDHNPIPLTEHEFELPEGTWDFIASFVRINPDNFFHEDPEVIYIAEQVNVTQGTVIDLRPQESTICLRMETTNPDGEKTRFRKIRYLNADSWDFEILEEGNVSLAMLHKVIKIDDRVVRDLHFQTSGLVVEPGPKGQCDNQEYCNVYVNRVSDRVVFQNITQLPAWPDEDNGVYMAVTQCRGSHPGVYTNNSDYFLDESGVAPTPASAGYPLRPEYEGDTPRPYCFTFHTYLPDETVISSTNIQSYNPSIWKIWYSGPADEIDKDDLFMVAHKSFIDAEIEYVDKWGAFTQTYNTTTPCMFPYAPGGYVTTVDVTPFSDYPLAPDRYTLPEDVFPGNAPYMTKVSDPEREYAVSAPLLTFGTMPGWLWDNGHFVMTDNYSVQYGGRLGELMESTAALADVSLEVDGVLVASGKDETKAWLAAHTGEKGVRRYTVATDNFTIDDIQGGNTATITGVSGESLPSATMLQFRDKDGNPTQKFDNAADADILLSAADFKVMFDDEPSEQGDYWTWYKLSTPSKVTATCHPTLDPDAPETAIELTEDPEAFFPTQYGALYRGTLDAVSTPAPAGWFDLTITVENASGSRQVQTISPAFRIGALASLGNIQSDGDIRVEGRDITAPAGTRVYNLSGIETGLRNLAPGIYIAVTSGGVSKLAVR